MLRRVLCLSPAMAIIAIQHDDLRRSGRLGVTLRDHGFRVRTIRVDQGEALPADFDGVDGVVSLGGRQNVDEKHAWIEKELAFLREAHERSLPVLGICLGAQLIAKALGGEVGKMDRPEMGFTDVHLTPAAHTDTILTGIAWRSPQFQKHWYEVKTLPEGARLLATNPACKVQAYSIGMRTYAFQYHFECDRSMIDQYMTDAKTDLHQAGITTDEYMRQLESKYEMFARLGDRLCLNICTYLIPRVATEMRV